MAGRGRGRPILGKGTVGQAISLEAEQEGVANRCPEIEAIDLTQPPPTVGDGKQLQQMTNLSVYAPVFVPRFQSDSLDNSAIRNEQLQDESGLDSVDVLRQTIFLLSEDPASMERCMEEILPSLESSLHEESALQVMIEELFNQCVNDANFRYTGARACNYLAHNLSVEFASGNFRQHLLKRCHKEHTQRKEMITNPKKLQRLTGFALFMAEMLLSFTIGKNEKLKILANALEELLETLISQPTDVTLKCVAQVLKLSGSTLSQFEKTDSDRTTPKLDRLFCKLKPAIVDDTLPRSLRSLLLSAVELRASGWGEREATSNDSSSNNSSSQQNQYQSSYFEQTPVFYNSAGAVISAAEAGFSPTSNPSGADVDAELAENAAFYEQYGASAANEQAGDYWQPSAQECYYDSEEFDDEVAAAYEEFLKNQQNEASNWSTR